MNKPTIITVGYGRHMFKSGNSERDRIGQCAEQTKHLHAVVFTHRGDNLVSEKVSPAFTLYPTNSKNRLGMVYDAVRITLKIIKKETENNVVITTQDAFATGVVGWTVKKLRPVRWVAQEHGDVFLQPYWRNESKLNKIQYQIGLHLIKRADLVRVVSERVYQKMLTLGVPADKIRSLPVSIDVGGFARKTTCRTSDSKEPFHFITAARLVPQKNFPLLIKAFHQAWLENNLLRLTIVGSGPLQSDIESLLKETFNTTDSPVTLIAWSDDISSLLQKADAYVLSSNYEGWGRVLIEAMVTGLPVVTTDVGCAGEVLLDGVHGTVVSVDDQPALAQAILQLSTDSQLYQTYAHNLQSLDEQTIKGVQQTEYGKQWVATLAI